MRELTVKSLTLANSAYWGANGNFGTLYNSPNGGQMVKWMSCREEFARSCYDLTAKKWVMQENGFLFVHQNKKSEDIAEFVEKFEALVENGRKKPIHRSLIQRISTNGVIDAARESQAIFVTPSLFWLAQTMRFSLFSMLFRCANFGYHMSGDFFTALFQSYDLANQCKGSISRFMDGYNWYTGKNDGLTQGWYNTFNGMEARLFNSDNWKMLIRPNPKPKKPAPSEDSVLKEAAK